MKHELKIKPEYFSAVVTGEKNFEIRNNADRNFQVGDTLLLKEWDGEFNGNFVERTISYITDFEQKPGYVVLGLVGAREFELLERLTSIGIAIDKAAMSGKVPDQHPMKNRLDMLAKSHQKMLLIDSLNDDLLDLVEHMVNYMGLAGEKPEKDSHNPIRAWMHDAISTMAGQRTNQPVTVTEAIRTAPERIWLQVGDRPGDSDHPFPDDHEGVSWCDEQVMPCEVPYVRADLVVQVQKQHKTNWPDKCPITRRDFFMEIDGVPTYGGPFDSYTIPEMLGTPEQPWHERELFVRRFDHDEGRWVDDEIISQRVIHDGVLDELLDLKEQQAAHNGMVSQAETLAISPSKQGE